MPTFPAALPAPALNSFIETPPANDIRTQMDKGPDKARPRTTANVRPLSFNLKLTAAQTQTLDDFYVLVGSSVEFDYTHPRTLSAVTARFVAPPQYAEVEGALYNCALQVEIMP